MVAGWKTAKTTARARLKDDQDRGAKGARRDSCADKQQGRSTLRYMGVFRFRGAGLRAVLCAEVEALDHPDEQGTDAKASSFRVRQLQAGIIHSRPAAGLLGREGYSWSFVQHGGSSALGLEAGFRHGRS